MLLKDGRERFMADEVLQRAAERNIQIAIQSAIDVATHIVAEDSAKAPADYRAAFTILNQNEVISQSLAGRLRQAAGLRNILVHVYLQVDPERIWAAMHDLGDLEEFAQAVTAYLREHP